MWRFQFTPTILAFILLVIPSDCQFDPYGGSPFYGEPQPYGDQYLPEAQPQPQPPSYYPNNFNPFLPAGQNQAQSQQQQSQGFQQNPNPNLAQIPFQTVTQNPLQRVDRYPFPSQNTGNVGLSGVNNNNNNVNNNQLQQFLNQNQQYPKVPNFPFQTIQPGGGLTPPGSFPQVQNTYPRTALPKVRVIEYADGEFFEYGGGKLVQPKRPNSDLYVGGVGGDVPITSKIFIECTGPNQVEWIHNGTERRDLSVVTKNFQITIPEERGPSPLSGEYTYLRLGLEQKMTEKDGGVYLCRDRILPQNYITIRVIVAKPVTGSPHYPFIPNKGQGQGPKDPNTIYFSRSDSTVTLPCKIENADATISLHKHEAGKLSCPYQLDGRVFYDRFKGFTIQTGAFRDLEGRYVCVGDFGGELRLMKYKLVATEGFSGFTTRFVEGETQNVISLDGQKKSSGAGQADPPSLLAKVDSNPFSSLTGLTPSANLTASGFIDPRSEFESESLEGVPSSNILPILQEPENSLSINTTTGATTTISTKSSKPSKL